MGHASSLVSATSREVSSAAGQARSVTAAPTVPQAADPSLRVKMLPLPMHVFSNDEESPGR